MASAAVASGPAVLASRLRPGQPKRILALDGGGVRGLISLAFAERIESILAERSGRPDARLADYFDLIGGTSTGAIIAAGLALGYSAAHMIDLYLELSTKGFKRQRWLGGTLAPKFDATALRSVIVELFGTETLGSSNLRSGLGIVAKRLDSGSVWLFHNHPEGRFFSPESADVTPNRDMLLADLLRASTAAPSYFAPEALEVAPGTKGLFVDGGVSPHNNPALLLLMLATMQGYGFRWPLGADRLMLTSLGAGTYTPTATWGTFERTPAALLGVDSLRAMIQDCGVLAQTMLQWMSNSPTAWHLDDEIGDLRGDQLAGVPLLHYLRYELPLTNEWLATELGVHVTPKELELLKQIDRPDLAHRLLELGRKAADKQVMASYFTPTFDNP